MDPMKTVKGVATSKGQDRRVGRGLCPWQAGQGLTLSMRGLVGCAFLGWMQEDPVDKRYGKQRTWQGVVGQRCKICQAPRSLVPADSPSPPTTPFPGTGHLPFFSVWPRHLPLLELAIWTQGVKKDPNPPLLPQLAGHLQIFHF